MLHADSNSAFRNLFLGNSAFAARLWNYFSPLAVDAVTGTALTVPTIASEGRNVSLRCTWTAGTNITVQWGKGDAAIIADSRITISGDSLVINPARRSDTGEYTCTASNPVSAETAKRSLTVYCECAVIKTSGSCWSHCCLFITHNSLHAESWTADRLQDIHWPSCGGVISISRQAKWPQRRAKMWSHLLPPLPVATVVRFNWFIESKSITSQSRERFHVA